MYKTVIVVAVLAFALQCALGSPVAQVENTTPADDVTVFPSTHGNDISSSTASPSNETTTTTPTPSSGTSSAGNCILFVQIFAIALATRLVVL